MNKSIYFAGKEQISNSTYTSWILCSRNDSTIGMFLSSLK